jgi:hypothetical protein
MRTSPGGAAHPADDRQASRALVASLRDRLLLSIRDGDWHPVATLGEWLAPRVAAEPAVRRYLEAGGTLEKKLDHKASAGRRRILQDILEGLRDERLLAFRTNDAGAEEVRSTPRVDERFELDAEFDAILPRAPDEVKKLEERLLAEAPRDPLVVWKGQRLLVDGYTRYRFLALLGRDYPVVELDFPDRAAVVAWLYDAHYGRRSYSAEMKSYVRGKQYLARKHKHGGARKKASAGGRHLKTADVVAAEYGVASATVRQDAVFAAALDHVADRCGDEVRQQVLARVAQWTRRDIQRLARLDKATLQGVVGAALGAGIRPRFPSPAAGERPRVKAACLPVSKPVEQLRVLRKVLGETGLARLYTAMTRFFAKAEGGG